MSPIDTRGIVFPDSHTYHNAWRAFDFGKLHRSQDKEDMALYEQFFEGQRDGTFVEIGALDGLRISNTFAFEKAMGWGGVLIEANPESCARLFKNRRGPKVHTLCSAVTADSHPVLFETGEDAAVFAAVERMSAGFRQKTHPPHMRHNVTVASAPLGFLLRALGVSHVDLFSVDVEGSQDEVLSTFDWSIPVRVWCIERGSTPRITRLMKDHGYTQAQWLHDYTGRLARNTLWVRDSWTPAKYQWRPWVPPRPAI